MMNGEVLLSKRVLPHPTSEPSSWKKGVPTVPRSRSVAGHGADWSITSRGLAVHEDLSHQTWLTFTMLSSASGLLLGCILVVLSVMSAMSPASRAATLVGEPTTGDARAKGDPGAPVVITEWSDFQCPDCRSFAQEVEPEIDRLYVSTGKVRFVARSLAFEGAESLPAAQASMCAADQRRFWAYRNLLWQRGQAKDSGTFQPENLKRYASELGLDRGAFDACLDQEVHKNDVIADITLGVRARVQAAPSLLVNDKMVSGAPSLTALSKLIDQELERKP